MSKEQASLATRRFDQNGDGTVSLCDFLAFAGKPYTANDRPLEAKLRRVLLKAEAVRGGADWWERRVFWPPSNAFCLWSSFLRWSCQEPST